MELRGNSTIWRKNLTRLHGFKKKVLKTNKTTWAKNLFSFFAIFVAFPAFSIASSNNSVSLKNAQIGGAATVIALADVFSSNGKPYTALLGSDVASHKTIALSCYPEHLEVISGGKMLQVRNSFGNALYDLSSGKLRWIDNYSSFLSKNVLESVSSNGEWTAFVSRTEAGHGKLCVKQISSGESRVLDPFCEFDYKSVPVKWASDGSILLYQKNGAIYFCEPSALFSGLQADERYRSLGEGTLDCVSWNDSKSLVRVSGDIVYKIDAKQLHTRALYQPLVGNGKAICRLPFQFDSKTDKFYASPDGSSFVLISRGSIVSVYKKLISSSGESFAPSAVLKLPESRAALDFDVLWSDGSPLIWVGFSYSSVIYRIKGSANPIFEELLDIDSAFRPVVSPNGKLIAVASDSSLFVRDVKTMNVRGRLDGEKAVSFVWNGSDTVFLGGESSVKEWKISTGEVRTLFLSSVKDAAFSGGKIISQTETNRFFEIALEEGDVLSRRVDFSKSDFSKLNRLVQNGYYRVFVSEDNSSLFVRELSGFGNTTLLWTSSFAQEKNGKTVRLVIDALDDATGLDYVLSVLERYRVKATFFLNGEFIRRYPEETRRIAKSPHDCASMFFAAADLSSLEKQGYVIDEDFVRRGLSRNEDEFFSVTGKELSLFWHAPFYSCPEKAILAAKKSGYSYVDALPLYQSSFESLRLGFPYWSSLEIISASAKNPPKVLCVGLGSVKGGRDDFLWEKLDVLLSELLDSGCTFDTF